MTSKQHSSWEEELIRILGIRATDSEAKKTVEKLMFQNQPSRTQLPSQDPLGQVFTSPEVAKVMIQELMSGQTTGVVLDPCAGKNIFFKTIDQLYPSLKDHLLKVGLEVDPRFFQEQSYKTTNTLVYNRSFFELLGLGVFDFVVMNPPYVRQEELAISQVNSKQRIISTLSTEYNNYLQKTYNLYVFFFIKAHQVLKEGGRLVGICYDSWLNTKFGDKFKDFLVNHFQVDQVLHFEHRAFIDAEVGATVLTLTKKSGGQEIGQGTTYHKYRFPSDHNAASPQLSTTNVDLRTLKWVGLWDRVLDFRSDIFVPLSSLSRSSIRRGVEAKASPHFVLDERRFPEAIPLVKDVKQISGLVVTEENLHYLLAAQYGDVTEQTDTYLREVAQKLLRGSKFRVVRQEIQAGNPRWFELRLVEPGNILFNYYLRKRIRFLYNPNLYHSSDNFYILDSRKDLNPLLCLLLLNSVFTRLAVLRSGRSQGSGLQKVQVYEFKQVPIIDPLSLDDKQVKKLGSLGELLLQQPNKEYIILRQVDELLYDVLRSRKTVKGTLDEVYAVYDQLIEASAAQKKTLPR